MESFSLNCDNIFVTNSGTSHFIEAMFSERFNLSTDLAEISLRIHPSKKSAFDLLMRENANFPYDQPKNVVEFRVNNAPEDAGTILYQRLKLATPKNLMHEVEVEGFDHNANPVIRQLTDGSLRILFCNMPPVSFVGDLEFDMNEFGTGLMQCSRAKITWEDRDVFYASDARPDDIESVKEYIANYGKTTSSRSHSSTAATNLCNKAIAYLKAAMPATDKIGDGISLQLSSTMVLDQVICTYVVDNDKGLLFLQDYHREEDNLSLLQLHEISLRNLQSLCDRQLEVKKMADVYGIFLDGNFEASALLLDELWDKKLSHYVSDSFVIAAPERSVLAFCDSSSQKGIETLQEIVRRVYNDSGTSRYRLTQDLYQRVNGRWVKWSPTTASSSTTLEASIDSELQEKMKAFAEKLRQLVKEKMNVSLAYDAKSLQWIHAYIGKLSEKAELKNRDNLIHLLAVFCAECYLQSYGGHWRNLSDCTVIVSGTRTIDPFDLVRRQMDGRDGTRFYELFVATQKSSEATKNKRVHEGAEMPQLDRTELAQFKMAQPPWIASDPLNQLFRASERLLHSGRITWAALVQGNRKLFEDVSLNGIIGAPGEVVYDPSGKASMADLAAASKPTLALRNGNHHDPQLQAIADHLNSETKRVFGLAIPSSISTSQLKMSSIWLDRSFFPHGIVCFPCFPVLISDQDPGLVLPVPAQYWTQSIKSQWLARLPNAAQAISPFAYKAPAELEHLNPFNLIEEGALYLRGDGIPQNFEKAKAAFERAIEQGSASGYEWLAKMYEAGQGVEKSLEKAVLLRAKAKEIIEKRQTDSPTNVQQKPSSPEEAFNRELQKYADDPAHQLFLRGVAHYSGQGAEKSLSKARSYWRQAGQLGHADSLYNLACMYFDGEFAKADRRTAMAYFEEAARLGSEDSLKFLSTRRKTLLGIFEWNFRKKDIFKQ